MSVATLTVLALRASIEQVGTHLLCLLIVSFSFYLPNFVLEISCDFFRKQWPKQGLPAPVIGEGRP